MPDENRTTPTHLSWPTLIGGAVAAVSATALSTRLGLVGTALGAGLASAVSTVVATIAGHWLERLRGAARQPVVRLRSVLVVGGAVALVVAALGAGVDLLTSDLPHDALASRVLARLTG